MKRALCLGSMHFKSLNKALNCTSTYIKKKLDDSEKNPCFVYRAVANTSTKLCISTAALRE